MNNTTNDTENQVSGVISPALDVPLAAEQARQLALGKISRRYAAYIVPAALAVMSNSVHAS